MRLGEQWIQCIWVCDGSPTLLTQKALKGKKAIVHHCLCALIWSNIHINNAHLSTHLNGTTQLLSVSDLQFTSLGSPVSNTNRCCWRKPVQSTVFLCHNTTIPRTLTGNIVEDARAEPWRREQGFPKGWPCLVQSSSCKCGTWRMKLEPVEQ